MAHVVGNGELPDRFPTHLHDAIFWEELGRVVATFGFLEEVLGKAIFAFTGTRPYSAEEDFRNPLSSKRFFAKPRLLPQSWPARS